MTDGEKLDLILAQIGSVNDRMGRLEADVQETKQEVKATKLMIENEIRVNIQRVAEGHLDLSRNLHEAMKPSNELEMLSIKVRWLETEVRELKAKMA